MNTPCTRIIAIAVLAGVALAAGAYARTGEPMSRDGKVGMDKMGHGEMVENNGPMAMDETIHMTGSGNMNGHSCFMTAL